MTTDNGAVLARPHSAEDLDEVFEVLAHEYRRTIVGELGWGETQSLDDLVALVAEEADGAPSATDIRLSLVHNHLPRLAKADVITYDDEAKVAELDDAVAERAVLAAVSEAA